ncbi:hypothetical protein KJ782_02965, partial [Patescibacteria group bacterium]|nr:hypothetical protein [Patescibacteria group bacterium]
LLIDWFGVCTKENWGNCLGRELNKALGVDEQTVRGVFHTLIQPFARNELSPDQFLEKFIGSLDKEANPKDFEYLFGAIPELNTELLDYIKALRSKFTIYLFSNNFGAVFPNYQKQINFNEYFDKLLLSHKLGFSKTQDQIWDAVFSKIYFKPTEILFIDNKENYLQRAKQHHVHTLLYRNVEQVRRYINTEIGKSVNK